MRSIPFTCLLSLVLAASGFYQEVSGLKPRIIPAEDEIILEEGDDLIIRCEGDRQLQFLPEESPDNPNLEYESSYDEESRLHKFVFRNVSYLNTAWYACAEAGVDLKNNEQIIDHSNDDISWIYVYVNSSRPFPSANPVRLFPAIVGQTVVIPCRPTSPDLSVKLQIDFEDNEDPRIRYVPKVGFILENVSVILSGISYGCIANIPDPDEMEPLITLHVTHNILLPEPTIDEKSVRHVVWGENHTFICNTTMVPDGNFVLRWTTPPSIDKSRISLKTFGPRELGYVVENNQYKSKHSVELTVMDVKISDGGEYTCYITGPNNEKVKTSVNITISGVSGLKPRMIPEKDEMILNEGEDLTIQCDGDEWLQFLPEESPDNPKLEYESTYDEELRSHKFVFRNVSYLNTAWYACAEAGVDLKNNEQIIDHSNDDISWIYVYVNSSRPFPSANPVRLFPAIVGQTVVIPCRPTSPDLSVRLQIDFEDNEDPRIRYVPKVGFILENVSVILSGISYGCVANIPDPDEMEPLITLHVTPDNLLTEPTIDEKSTRHVVWGENHTFICNTTTAPDGNFALRWRTPPSIDKSRISIKTFGPKDLGYVTENNQLKSKHSVELTVMDVKISDGGEYTCYAAGPNKENVKTSRNITISDPNHTFINVTIDKMDGTDSSLIVLNESNTAIWKIKIDTYPPGRWEWLKPNNEEILNFGFNASHSKYSHSEENMDHFFRISSLELKDNGNYTLRVITPSATKDTILSLRVDAKPLAIIENASKYYTPEKSTIFTCEILASPRPNITWTYREYPNYPLKSPSRLAPLGKIESKPVDHSPHIVKSFLNLTLRKEGDLICEACNDFGCNTATEPIFLSDMGDEAFSISDPGLVTVGDTINLTCSASIHNYTNELSWNDKPYARPGFSIINCTTNFTHQSTINMNNVSKSDSGEYSCNAVNFEGKTEPRFFTLTVNDAMKPTLAATNFNESKVVINLKTEKERSMTLKCNITGMPIPKIIWLKDNEEAHNKRYIISKDNTTFHVKYFLEGDSGKYSCKGVNRLGFVERYIDIVVEGEHAQDNLLWISLICVLIIIIIVVITCMGIRVHRERLLRKELCDAGLTHFADGAVECLNPDLPIDDQAELLPYDKKWEFPQDLLKIGKQLGSGAFGVVMKAEARGICTEGEITTVAVKMVRRSAEPSYMRALASELKIMIHLGRHLNVVNLLGACTKNILTKRELYVIVEYCRFGNLHNYLQRHRSSFINQIDPGTNKIDLSIGLERLGRSESVGSQNRLKYADLSFCRSFSVSSADSNSGSELVDYRQVNEFGEISMSPGGGGVLSNNSVQPGWRSNYRGDYKDQNLKPICTHDLLCWAWQVSRGMEYLSSRNVLHGDLAARNILLADDNIVKICDFGLAKNMYKDNNYKKKGDGPLPIKWMAIESIRDRIYSTQSDVWSFGIVLWEFFTLACTPYPGMEAETQYDRLIEGYRMPKPDYATDEIYEDIMKDCWKAKPSLRPTFTNLVEKIGTLLNESVKMYYCELDTPYMEMNTAKLQDGQNDYLTMMASPSHDYHNAPEGLSDIRLDSDYLSMSPLKKDKPDSAGIFSPRAELAESHFEFPSPTSNATVNSDSEDNCVESVPMLNTEDPYLVPVDVHQRRSEFANKQVKSIKPGSNNDYSNLPNNHRADKLDSEDSTPDIIRLASSDQKIFDQKNDNDTVLPIIYSGNDNYVNMPQRNKNNERINKDPVDSFSNPSYVIMSKLENDSKFV